MGIINILDAQTANMIAAGEVVDRPASALKELLENALDAGAKRISVEIKGGGRAFLRITDDGKGFYRDDIPKALLRHATSKIKNGTDLNEILTFGFRGEALAAISSVSRMEIISRHADETVGTRLTSDENGVVMDDTGCPVGTTVIVKDLFYNTPARQKFLKRDMTETSACVSVASAAAISHPEVSFTVSVEGERRFYTAGDGRLLQALYAIYGKSFAGGLIEVSYELDGVKAHGYVSTPDNARGNRGMQMFYVNGRSIRSKTMQAALEEAFRSYLPHGRYPACVLFLEIPCTLTDVNVHPAKLEIKFANERPVFSAVYYAVKNKLNENPTAEKPAEQTSASEPAPADTKPAVSPELVQTPVSAERPAPVYTPVSAPPKKEEPPRRTFNARIGEEDLDMQTMLRFAQPTEEEARIYGQKQEQAPTEQQVQIDERPYHRLLGEAYNAFLFVETKEEVLVIDKHAAHERILYEKLASKKEVHTQQLLSPIPLTLADSDVANLCENAPYLAEFGFEIEPFGSDTLLVRAVPASLANTKDLKSILERFASDLLGGSRVSFAEKCDRALFTVACKAALKAGIPNDKAHNEWVVQQLMANPSLRFCPHGRPVMHALTRKEIEGYFDR